MARIEAVGYMNTFRLLKSPKSSINAQTLWRELAQFEPDFKLFSGGRHRDAVLSDVELMQKEEKSVLRVGHEVELEIKIERVWRHLVERTHVQATDRDRHLEYGHTGAEERERSQVVLWT